ncbi:hypothetical protein [Sorangium atrum]|uniref:Uncharacterized protein n=1 Tax=Sorangium atrum TaxID=2995308 RepID=A0ABT5BPW3_9BACT|nr:hypothetical protein [Sorangium aterium]MDC0676187.1 hypothetical protein [Sorangium aterium]
MLDLRPIGDQSAPGAKWLVAAAQGKRSISAQFVNNLNEAIQVVSFSQSGDATDWMDGMAPYDGQIIPPVGNNAIWVGTYIDTVSFNEFGFTITLYCAGQQVRFTAKKPKTGAATITYDPESPPGLSIPKPIVVANATGNYPNGTVTISKSNL